MICNDHFTIDDYQKRPDLIKLTNRAVPTVFNCVENTKTCVNQNKMATSSDFKHSEKTVKKCYDNLTDHTYVLKLPESPDKNSSGSLDNSFDPSVCMIQTLKVIENVNIEPKPLDLSSWNKPTLEHNKSNLHIFLSLLHYYYCYIAYIIIFFVFYRSLLSNNKRFF